MGIIFIMYAKSCTMHKTVWEDYNILVKVRLIT